MQEGGLRKPRVFRPLQGRSENSSAQNGIFHFQGVGLRAFGKLEKAIEEGPSLR